MANVAPVSSSGIQSNPHRILPCLTFELAGIATSFQHGVEREDIWLHASLLHCLQQHKRLLPSEAAHDIRNAKHEGQRIAVRLVFGGKSIEKPATQMTSSQSKSVTKVNESNDSFQSYRQMSRGVRRRLDETQVLHSPHQYLLLALRTCIIML